MEEVILDFENITKYPLLDFFVKYRDFMVMSYPEINRYYSGETTACDSEHFKAMNYLLKECENILTIFKNFSNKFSVCAYWELMEYIEMLNQNIQKISKLPKFKRTSLTKRGYQPFIQVKGEIGSFKTMEDLSETLVDTDWTDIMLSNDLNEEDWNIDELGSLNLLISNQINPVSTILDQPIGQRIYGIDIDRKISFKDNDLALLYYRDNVEQKCNILLELNRGDVPENPMFGKNFEMYVDSIKQFMYSELVKDIKSVFSQNDLFESVDFSGFEFNGGQLQAKCNIKTKYDYKTEKIATV